MSGRGSNWLTNFWKSFCKLTGITQRLTAAYHTQSNASERANQEGYKYLRVFTCYAQHNWMDFLPLAQLTLNTRPSSNIGGMSPFFLRNGYNLGPLSEPTRSPESTSRHPGTIAAHEYIQRFKDAQEFSQAAMASAQQRSEINKNRNRRQPERFKVGDKVWLNLEHIQTPQLSKKLAWQHTKHEVIGVSDALNVELNVPGHIQNRFHVELVKRAGNNPFPSQARDDEQNPPLIADLEEKESEVQSILRARTICRGRGKFRQVLVKWVGWVEPTWEPVGYVKDTVALENFEKKYGPVDNNDGPAENSAGLFVGQPESHVKEQRRKRLKKRKPY